MGFRKQPAVVFALSLALFFTASASATHVRPKGAGPLHASLVPAYTTCSNPDRTHGPPLAAPSCAQPSGTTSFLTVGTPDANGAAANATASVRFRVLPGAPGPPHDTQIAVYPNVTDVRCAPGAPACGSANAQAGPDYAGEVQVEVTMRITDTNNAVNPGGGIDHATMTDYVLRLPLSCVNTASTAIGATCAGANDLSNFVPGIVPEGKRAIWEMGAVRFLDGGPDGIASTADNTVFLTQGIFVP
jgi:hypothetical protein